MQTANDKVRRLLEGLVGETAEVGLQVAAYLNGKLVIDAWAGLADENTKQRINGETLFTAFSISKGITATCVHILAERGLVHYDARIVEYWPEFGAHGKANTTVRDVLTHRAGIPQDPPGFDLRLAGDWERVCSGVASLEPLWEPGTRTAYHPLTYGWILGEVIRRVDGRPIDRFLQEEVCRPLAIDGMYFGIGLSEAPRVATLKNAPHLKPLDLPSNPSLSDLAGTFNSPEVRRATIPGAGALVNARSVARLYAALANGEFNGVRLLSQARVSNATRPEFETTEGNAAEDSPWFLRHALGYTLGGGPGPMAGHVQAFGYEGLGTIGFADPSRKFAFAFLKNLLDWSDNEMNSAVIISSAVEEALGIV